MIPDKIHNTITYNSDNQIEPWSSKDTLICFLIGAIAFIVYLYTLSPTILFGDSGELVTAVYLLGVPHPTGFPVYLLLAKLFSFLPLGEFAYRLSVFSALISAINVSLIYIFLRKIIANKYIIACVALSYAFAATVWFHATYAQTYSLAAFFGLLGIILCFELSKNLSTPSARLKLSLFFFLTGLSIGVHVSAIFLILGAVSLLIIRQIDRYEALRKHFISASPFFIFGLCVFLYIPLRASQNPPINWDNPSNISNFIYYISQRQWGYMMFNRGLYQTYIFLKEISGFLWREFTPLGLGLIIFGIILLYKKNKQLLVIVSVVVTSNILFFYIYGNQSNLEVLYRYFLPSYIVLTVPLVFALQEIFLWINKRVKQRRARFIFSMILVLLLPLANLFFHYKFSSNRNNTFARDHAANLLNTAPENGVLILQTEDDVFPLLYAHYVLGLRPDVKIYDRSGNVFGSVYKISEQQFGMTNDLVNRWKFEKDNEIITDAEGEVFFGDTSNPGVEHIARGLLFLDKKTKGENYDTDRIFSKYLIPDINNINQFFKNREEYSRYLLMKARGYLDENRKGEALQLVDKAVQIAPDAWYTMQYSYFLYSAAGEKEKAIDVLEEAVKTVGHLADPEYLLGLAYVKEKKIDKAIDAYENALFIDPGYIKAKEGLDSLSYYKKEDSTPLVENESISNTAATSNGPEYYLNQGIAYGQSGETEKAIEQFKKAVEIDDKFAPAHFNLGNAYMNSIPPDIVKAKLEFEKTISLNPDMTLAYLNLGSLCDYKLLDYNCAIKNWQTYLKKTPGAPEKENIEKEITRMKSLLK